MNLNFTGHRAKHSKPSNQNLKIAASLTALTIVQPSVGNHFLFGAQALLVSKQNQESNKPQFELTPRVPDAKMQNIFADPSVVRLNGVKFCWADITDKRAFIFMRKSGEDPWKLSNILQINPGRKMYDPSIKRRRSKTPAGDYKIADQGAFRFSKAYHNAPMPFYSRIWQPSFQKEPGESGIFFHVGDISDIGSQGCLRTTEKDARFIQEHFDRGDTVLVRPWTGSARERKPRFK
jgi:hypothetical protein